MIDFGEVVGKGIAVELGPLWAEIAAYSWTVVLFAGVVAAAVWLQLTSTRRPGRQ